MLSFRSAKSVFESEGKPSFDPKLLNLNRGHRHRKVLFAEISFYTRVLSSLRSKATVIYLGSAPGVHLPTIAALFPNLTFILIDPKLHAPLPDSQMLESFTNLRTFNIVQAHASVELVTKIASKLKNVLLVSDIKSSRFKIAQIDLLYDLSVQALIWRELSPKAALLTFSVPTAGFEYAHFLNASKEPFRSLLGPISKTKKNKLDPAAVAEFWKVSEKFSETFRCSDHQLVNILKNDHFEYPALDIELQPCCRPRSSETKVFLTDSCPVVTFSCSDYENLLQFQNSLRMLATVQLKDYNGLECACVDCSIENQICAEFVEKFKNKPALELIFDQFREYKRTHLRMKARPGLVNFLFFGSPEKLSSRQVSVPVVDGNGKQLCLLGSSEIPLSGVSKIAQTFPLVDPASKRTLRILAIRLRNEIKKKYLKKLNKDKRLALDGNIVNRKSV